MLLRLIFLSFGSLFFIRFSVFFTFVEFGFSFGIGLYCVGLIIFRTVDKREVVYRGGRFFFNIRTSGGSGGRG